MRKCGFHVQQTSNELKRAIEAVRPTIIVSLAHDADFWRAVKADFPDVFLIGRLYEIREGFSSWWVQVDPRRWAEECASLNMPYDAWITRNEPDGINNEVTGDYAKRYDEWCCVFRERALELGFEAVGPNVAAGNWHGGDIVKWLPNLCKTFKYIARHEYSARAMWDQAPALERPPDEVPKTDGEKRGWWYTLTYRGWKRAICESYPWREGQFQVIISEGGVAYGVIPDAQGQPKYGDVGWRTDMSEEQYVASLDWYTGELDKDDYCLGWAIFMVGAADPKWNSFETLHLWPVLAEFPETEPQENGGEMDIKVFDMDNVERDLAWAVEKYGVAFRRYGAAVGEQVYRLVELREKSGTASLVTQVLDEAGNPIANMGVALYWPDAPDPPDPPTTVYAHDWYKRFVHGPTNVNGDVGPGMGTGAYHGRGEGGPHAVWVRDPDVPSDICEKLGMLAGTPHDHLDQVFQLMVEIGEEPQPPPGDLAAEVDAIGDRLKQIALEMANGGEISEILVRWDDGSEQAFTVAE